MKRLTTFLLVLGTVLCITGCSEVNEDVTVSEEAVYISPSASAAAVNYPLSLLDENEQQLYDKLVDAVINYDETVVLEGADDFTAKKLFKLMYTQENRIFWADSRYIYDDTDYTMDLIYRYDSVKSEEMRAVLDFEAAKILAEIPDGASDYEKIKILHDALILRCSFSKAGDYVNTAYGVIVDGAAQCEGYAFAMSYLCSSAGIENYVVTGTSAEGDSHAWNKVMADGEWYNVDCAWDDPILKRESQNYIRHDYMFLSDAEINGISHFPDTTHFEPIPCISTANNYFIREGLYCRKSSEAQLLISDEIKKAAAEDRYDVEIKLSNEDAYIETVESLFSKGGLKAVIETLNGSTGAGISSAIKSVNDELHTIHISLIYEGEE